MLIFTAFHLYRSLWSYASSTELMYVVSACVVDSIVNMVCILVMHYDRESQPLPRSYYLLYGMFLLAFTLFGRYFYRLLRIMRGRVVIDRTKRKRVLIIGAGAAGSALIKEIIGSKHVNMQIVGAIDDDPGKRGTYIHGVRVLGNRDSIIEYCEELSVQEIMIALPSATAKEIKDIVDICKQTGCELKRLPGMYQLVNGDVSVSKLKEVDVNDLLGREPVKVDLDSILGYVSGKVVKASDKAQVKKFVMISTDKAVTHPDIIRYFMTIPEAVSLVLQAGAFAKGGEIFVLDMGEPVKILDLATNLILLSGHKPNEDIRIEFTGLRPGEKLYEEGF